MDIFRPEQNQTTSRVHTVALGAESQSMTDAGCRTDLLYVVSSQLSSGYESVEK